MVKQSRYGIRVRRLHPDFCNYLDRAKYSTGLNLSDTQASKLLATKLGAIETSYKVKKKNKKWADVIVRVKL